MALFVSVDMRESMIRLKIIKDEIVYFSSYSAYPTFSSKILFDIFESLLVKKEICTKEALTENQ